MMERRDLMAVSLINLPSTSPSGLNFTAGALFSGQIATFVATDGAVDGSNYSGTINWGDGSVSTGVQIQYDPNINAQAGGAFDVVAQHTYRAPGPETITLTIEDGWDTTSAVQSAAITVADQRLAGTPSQPILTQAQQGVAVAPDDMATFTDDNPLALASDFTATIQWGDGTSTAANAITQDAGGTFHVVGGHTYQHPAPAGGYQLAIQISDGPSSLMLSNTMNVVAAPLVLTAAPVNLDVDSQNPLGQAILPSGTVIGTFTQVGTLDPAAAYQTSASFARFAGSKSATPVAVTLATNGGSNVVATAADTVIFPYLAPGTLPFTLQVMNSGSGALALVGGSVAVSDVAPTASNVQPTLAAVQGAPFSGAVAGFQLDFGGTQDLSGLYAASINWGDGSPSTSGMIKPGATPGSYVVSGTHTYSKIGTPIAGQAAGTEPISVIVTRLGMMGASLGINTSVTIADPAILATALPVSQTTATADGHKNAIVPAGTTVGTFTQTGGSRLTTAYSGSTVTFAGSSSATSLNLSFDPASGIFTAKTAADTVIAPYLQPGSTPFTLTIVDPLGQTALATGSLNVTDVPADPTSGQPVVQVVEGQVFSGPVATFTLPYGSGMDLSAQLAASINWGDGSAPTAGTVRMTTTPGTYVILGTHTYTGIGTKIVGQNAGTNPITATVTRTLDAGAVATVSSTATVTDAPITLAATPISLTAASVDAQGNAVIPAGTVVGTFRQVGGLRLASAYAGSTATFVGSAAPTPLTISATGDGTLFLAVTAAPTTISPYFTPGATPFQVMVVDGVGGASATTTAALNVADVAPIIASTQPTVNSVLDVPFSGAVASFSTAFGANQDLGGLFSASINWGDGSAATLGTIQATGGGSYVVTGSHAYANIGTQIPGQPAGTYPVAVTITRVGPSGLSSTASTVATVTDLPNQVSGALSPSSDSGVSNLDGITNVSRPLFTGTTTPGSTVTLVALASGASTPFIIGTTMADASGAWSLTTTPLADGAYSVAVASTDRLGLTTATALVMPNSRQGSLVVQTHSPHVANVAFNRRTSQVTVTFDDVAGSLNLASLTNPAAYRFAAFANGKNLAPSSATLQSYDPAGHSATVVLNLNNGRRFPRNSINVAIAGSAITDLAGNLLDGSFHGTFPSGSSQPGSNFSAQISAIAAPTITPRGATLLRAKAKAVRNHRTGK